MARRLRALNLATWIAAAVSAGFALAQFVSSEPSLRKVAWVNATAALVWAAIPLLHRVGPLVAPVTFVTIIYVYVFTVLMMLGTGTGKQLYYVGMSALIILVFGIEHISLALLYAAIAAAFVVAVEIFAPYNTGIQSELAQFGSFVTTTIVSCGIVLIIVFFALREAANAEAATEREYARSEALLANILPVPVAKKLKGSNLLIADRYDETSVLFADMAGYTSLADRVGPEELVSFLNQVFTSFDQLVERRGLEKIKTTGDAYMVVSGVPTARKDHAQALGGLALEMRDAAQRLHDPTGQTVAGRIGLASGPVVAGIVGTKKFFYDVWGDPVNVASRMETTGASGQIHVSESFFMQAKDHFVFRGAWLGSNQGEGNHAHMVSAEDCRRELSLALTAQ